LKEAERLGLKADDTHPLGDAGIELNADGTNGGRTLGPLGSRIVGEVFFKLMKEDSESILGTGTTVVPHDVAGRVPAAGQFGAGEDGRFTLAHVMRYVHALPLTVTPQANFGLVSSSKR
jgi:hypothetical protein